MKPYSSNTDKGRARAGDDINHRTADLPREVAKKVAKVERHAARQDGLRSIKDELAAGDKAEPADDESLA